MALMRMPTCVGGGGSGLSSTRLWTNESPTADIPSSSSATYADATLSEDFNNFTYIEIIYKGSKSESVTADNANARSIIIETSKFANLTGYTGKYGLMALAGTLWYARECRQISGTTIRLYACYALNSATKNNGYCIPLAINGLK